LAIGRNGKPGQWLRTLRIAELPMLNPSDLIHVAMHCAGDSMRFKLN
jgi:hypothetical protein